jgi:hypothetical protein
MKKIISIIIIIIVIVIGYWLISPFFIDKVVSEDFPQIQSVMTGTSTNNTIDPIVLAQGSFTGFDKIHQGSGTVKIIKNNESYIVRFEDDFKASNGPDLYVGFGKNGQYVEGSDIAPLKGNIGSQNYTVPTSTKLSDYNEVWIWCRAFSVPFAKAQLTPLISK